MSNSNNSNSFQAPTFSAATQHAVATRGTPATLNLDDIFGDCFFTPEGDAVFLSEQANYDPNSNNMGMSSGDNQSFIQLSGEGTQISNNASKPIMTMTMDSSSSTSNNTTTTAPQFVTVPQAGGINTTGLANPGAKATIMGPATGSGTVPLNPMAAPPQQKFHLQFATSTSSAPSSRTGGETMSASSQSLAKKKRGGGVSSASSARERRMSDQQKSERR
jgi:hypothetical protein